MDLATLLSSFVHDKQLTLVAVLIAADLVFGVAAALKLKTFNLAYLATFARDDVLGKVVPWFALFAFSKVVAGDVIPGVDFGALATATFAIVTAALVGSLATSLADLGVPLPAIFGPRPETPAPPPAA